LFCPELDKQFELGYKYTNLSNRLQTHRFIETDRFENTYVSLYFGLLYTLRHCFLSFENEHFWSCFPKCINLLCSRLKTEVFENNDTFSRTLCQPIDIYGCAGSFTLWRLVGFKIEEASSRISSLRFLTTLNWLLVRKITVNDTFIQQDCKGLVHSKIITHPNVVPTP